MTEAQLAPNSTECTGCGQLDNHPKHHYGDRRYHFDCIPADVHDDSFGHLKGAEKKRIDTVIAHAHGETVEHLHGHDLRVKHIELDPHQPDEVKKLAGVKVSTRKGGSRG